MKTKISSLLVSALLLAPAFAQEGFDTSPAKELQKFAPLIGNWAGTGKMVEPSGDETPWQARGSYRWCLNKHFVQEDFVISFDGMPTPMVFRTYLGWDRENQRYVQALCSSEGATALNEIVIAEDGTMVSLMTHHQMGLPYAERARTKVDGDTMSMKIDLMMAEGPSTTVIESQLQRAEESFDGNWKVGGWMGAEAHEQIARLTSLVGTYEVKGDMVMAPGMPSMKITGTDTFAMHWDNNVMHGRTEGFAEGAPDAYVSEAFWAWDAHRSCIRAVFVDNMGQVGEMDTYWHDGKIVSISAARQQGMPTTQRFVLTFDGDGALSSGVGHTCMGTIDPFVSFRAKYTKK